MEHQWVNLLFYWIASHWSQIYGLGHKWNQCYIEWNHTKVKDINKWKTSEYTFPLSGIQLVNKIKW